MAVDRIKNGERAKGLLHRNKGKVREAIGRDMKKATRAALKKA